MKAYRCYHDDFSPEEVGIVFAENASKARYQAYLGASDVGYEVKLIEFKPRRMPILDYLHEDPKIKDSRTSAWSWDYMMHLQASNWSTCEPCGGMVYDNGVCGNCGIEP